MRGEVLMQLVINTLGAALRKQGVLHVPTKRTRPGENVSPGPFCSLD
jgi:hypothetical protein